jgi:hypothetical protein
MRFYFIIKHVMSFSMTYDYSNISPKIVPMIWINAILLLILLALWQSAFLRLLQVYLFWTTEL